MNYLNDFAKFYGYATNNSTALRWFVEENQDQIGTNIRDGFILLYRDYRGSTAVPRYRD